MDENKEFEKETEEIEEQIQESAEDAAQIIEEAAEKAEEIAEDAVEAIEEFAEDAADAVEDAVSDVAEGVTEFAEEVFAAPKKSKAPIIAIIVAAVIVVALCVLTAMGKFPAIYNKYNHMGYVNITGRTIADIAKDNDMELSELLEQYGLPKDMPGNTQESAAYYSMPVNTIAQMYGMDLDGLKELLGLGDEITEDTPWGKAEGEVTLEKYIGEDGLDAFKEQYGFGDEITLETKWKEVRNTVDKESKKRYDEQKAEQEKAEEETEETAAETEETDAEADAEAEETEDAE
jgi:ElaB/YqjD/DUF883 family membrane-anchored ribosome-binding protein